MPRGEDWSELEVEACVADYLRMLTLELNGQTFNKSGHARALSKLLDGRSRQSIEFKHCNISAVLLALDYPYIHGYKPRGNYQQLLADVVESQVAGNNALQDAASAAVCRPAVEIPVSDPNSPWVAPPKPPKLKERQSQYMPRFSAARRDYLTQEARNRSLGRAGELYVVELESRRLFEAGKKTLSRRVEHVAATQGDGLGFDVLSFEVTGRERLIEVKTTAFGELTPFYVSRNELARSNVDAETYHLFRVFDFRREPRLFDLPGDIALHCHIEPTTYLARLGG